MKIDPIAHIRTDFPEKFGIPRQSGLAKTTIGKIVFEPEYRNPDALRGLGDFDYIWLIWEFSANRRNKGASETAGAAGTATAMAASGASSKEKWQPTVRPPRLGGNKYMGVFATRSPFRPNPLGLSSVELDHIELDSPEGPVIYVRGADLMDGTPIYDIKPYITYADSHEDAKSGYVDSLEERNVEVIIPDAILADLARKKANYELFVEKLEEVLALDPRPSYQNDPERVYGMAFQGHNIHFTVAGSVLTVIDIQ